LGFYMEGEFGGGCFLTRGGEVICLGLLLYDMNVK
jgi:hypothetical protein